jgi:Zn-dependent peptidase ImmA (M78 family)
MSRADAEARSLTAKSGTASLPVDPEKVARNLGAIVIYQATPAELSGMLLRRDGQPVIGLNADLPERRQRFALAHLVGHLHLHRRRELLLDTAARYSHGNLASMPTDREEAEANRFAGALLAPESVVRRVAAETDFTTSAELVGLLASTFGLTEGAMTYRLMSLGIILDV